MSIHYPDNTASRTSITASGLTDSTALLDIYSGGERSLTLAELKKTGVQVLNAKQYGLRGDGITDDTTQFLLFCSGAAAATVYLKNFAICSANYELGTEPILLID